MKMLTVEDLNNMVKELDKEGVTYPMVFKSFMPELTKNLMLRASYILLNIVSALAPLVVLFTTEVRGVEFFGMFIVMLAVAWYANWYTKILASRYKAYQYVLTYFKNKEAT